MEGEENFELGFEEFDDILQNIDRELENCVRNSTNKNRLITENVLFIK
jgi:hypothetical protein